MRSPNAWFCDLCGQSWDVCSAPTNAQQDQGQQWPSKHTSYRVKSPRQRTRQKSRKKSANQAWQNSEGNYLSKNDYNMGWSTSSSWNTPAPVAPPLMDGKGFGKGFNPLHMQMASPPPPPPPMLVGPPMPHGVPWLPQTLQQPVHALPTMPFMPPMENAAQVPPPIPVSEEVIDEQKKEKSAQAKLNKIVKAAKKEDHLSPEFQDLVHAEMRKDDKESTDDLLKAVKELGDAKTALMEVEKARMQLWSQWRVFLQQSVNKWKEYTTQFQLSETSFHARMQEASSNLKRVQRRVDRAKKRADKISLDQDVLQISDDDMDEAEAEAESELPRDEHAQKIQEGLQQVVTSLTDLSESAEKLEPKAKRPRTKEEEELIGGKPSVLQPFAKADAS